MYALGIRDDRALSTPCLSYSNSSNETAKTMAPCHNSCATISTPARLKVVITIRRPKIAQNRQ